LPASISSFTVPATSSIGTSGVHAVLVEQVDAVGAESLQRSLDDLPDVLRPAVHTDRLSVLMELEPEVGGDHHPIPNGCEGLAHQLLVRERPVRLGGVEEGDAQLRSGAEERDRLLLVGRPGQDWRSAPWLPHPEGRDLERSELALLHASSS
jgi:hypothetical protein